ncbi:MAG: glycerate kinase [Acidobacteria bacterium]|nr:glycerate kinase [Acidobacteriota bacterium]MDW7983064.1 glycerate kinase [Acidobacteriota bacterium]
MVRKALIERWRRDAVRCFQTAVQAVDPLVCLSRWVRLRRDGLQVGAQTWPLPERVWVVGAGKASARMAQALEAILGDRIAGGIVVSKEGYGADLRRIQVWEAGHPIPDERSVGAAGAIRRQLAAVQTRDGVFVLLSGGASALLELPVEGVSLADVQAMTDLLLRAGATIHELNAVRKHLSQVKGGQLLRWVPPAVPVWTLVISDVVGNDLSVIGSGPTVPDPSTYADAVEVLHRLQVWDCVPDAVRVHLTEGQAGRRPETPKPGDPRFARSRVWVIGDNQTALQAAAQAARARGYHVAVLTSFLEGSVVEVARWVRAVARQVQMYGQPVRPPACILMGGETTVQVRGSGLGGRNQELATRVGVLLQENEPVVFLSAGTDGTDGPTDAAGGLVDPWHVHRARQAGIHPEPFLANNDAYHYLAQVGSLLKTGPTYTNVMDLLVLIVGSEK